MRTKSQMKIFMRTILHCVADEATFILVCDIGQRVRLKMRKDCNEKQHVAPTWIGFSCSGPVPLRVYVIGGVSSKTSDLMHFSYEDCIKTYMKMKKKD